MKIETFLDSYGVRNMCIAHDYCTCMDNEQYSKMLDWVNETTFGDLSIRLDDLSQAYVQNHYVNALRPRCDLTEILYHSKRNKSNARSTRKRVHFLYPKTGIGGQK